MLKIIKMNALRRFLENAYRTSTRNASYYVVLPEIPDDTPENNPVMQSNNFPKFSEITPEKIVSGCAKRSLEFQADMEEHAESLKSSPEKTFENVFHPIEKSIVPMYSAWRLAHNLNESNILYSTAFQRINKQLAKSEHAFWVKQPIYNATKELWKDKDKLTDSQAHLVDFYLSQGKLYGMQLAGEAQSLFYGFSKELSSMKGTFAKNVHMCDKMFAHRFNNFSVIESMPKSLAYHLAEDKSNPFRGPWKVTLQRNVYYNFMEYCSNRDLRWNIWHAYNNRATLEIFDRGLTNHPLIPEIRRYRRKMANLLDYKNYAELSLDNKMAGSVDNVINMMETLRSNFKPQAEKEIEYLQNFAESSGFKDSIQMWDVYYWRKKQYQQIYHLDDRVIAEYFPLQKVMEGLFTLCSRLFGIKVERSDEADVYDQTVQFFNVYDDDNSYISSFYFDPFARGNKRVEQTAMILGRDRCDLLDIKPFSYLKMNISPSLDDKTPPVLSLDEVGTLFCEFGRGLQQMLSKVPFSQLTGDRNLELDARDICSLFMLNWLYTPEVLRSISSQKDTGQPLPDDMITDIIKARMHMSSFDMMRQLYFGALDLELNMSKEHWYEVTKNVWHEYMPLPLDKDDNHTCSLTDIMVGNGAAAYYSHKWSEMIAADCFDAFVEAGQKPSKVSAVGKRFKDTFLGLAGGIPTSEIFRKFRGRDPSLEALQVMYGIKLDKKMPDAENVNLESA